MATGVKLALLLLWALAATEIEALTKVKEIKALTSDSDYCRNRQPSECCNGGRDDDCSVKIQDTLCYCDDFCLQDDPEVGAHDDCCPDYREVCLGVTKPPLEELVKNETAVCYFYGRGVPAGSYTFNCNDCVCENGRLTCEEDMCMVDEEVIQRVNNNPNYYGWKATNYSMFWGRKAEEGLFLKTGTLMLADETKNMLPIKLYKGYIPPEFDARNKWPGLISDVLNQGWCGASWAFSTVGVAQDRQMILTQKKVSLAPQQLLSCSHRPLEGCKGGHIDRAWNYMKKNGLVEERCFPYSSGASGEVPYCPRDPEFLACEVFKMEPAYRISQREDDIQWEILTNGPVQAVMWVKRDFFMYSSGVYRCPQITGEPTGMHSVRILGWGVDGTEKYWLVANSWGTDWGEGGLFRIRRGTDECGIESFVLAVRGRRDLWAKKGKGL